MNYVRFIISLHIIVAIFMVIPVHSQTEEEMLIDTKKNIKILFLGDSLTAGLGVDQSEAFPAVIERILGDKGYRNITVINAGISGSTTASAVSRVKWYARMRPDILFLALGANDGLRGLSLKSMEQNLDAAIEIALSSNMKVILASMEIPPNYGAEYTRDFRNVFRSVAKKHNIKLMPYLLKDVGGFGHLNQPDGIHPNADGYQIVAKNVISYILESLY